MIMKSLKLFVYHKIINIISTTVEEDEISYIRVSKDFGKLFIFNGCFMRLTLNSCIFVLLYNLLISIVLWAGTFLVGYTLIVKHNDFKMNEMVFLMNIGVLVVLSAIIHTTFFVRRIDAIILYRLIKEADKYREIDKDDLAESERIWTLSCRIWVMLILIAGPGLLLPSVFIDEEDSDSSTGELPLPIRFPFDTIQPFEYWAASIFLVVMIIFISIELSAALPAYLFVQKIVLELRSIISAIKTVHEKSFQMAMQLKGASYMARWRKINLDADLSKENKFYYYLYKDPIFLECYEKKFRDIIIHHQIILKIFSHYQHYGGIAILFVIGFSSFMIAISAYCIMSNDVSIGVKVTTFFVLIPQCLNIWVVCYYGEQTSTLAGQVRYELYFSNWIHCSAGVKRSIRIMQAKTLESISMCGAGFTVKANYDSFCTVVNSAYTYVNLLYAFQK